MRSLSLFVFLSCVVVIAAASWFATETPQEDAKKKNKSKDLISRTQLDGVTTLNADDFKKYVSKKDKPRKYGVVTMFTSSKDCEPCKLVEEQFNIAASSFRKQHPEHDGLFFVFVRLEEARQAFIDSEIQRLPAIVYFPPIKKGRRVEFLYDRKKDVHELHTSHGWTASGIVNFVYDRSGVVIDVPKAFLSHRGGAGGGAFMGGLITTQQIPTIAVSLLVFFAGVAWFSGGWRHYFVYFVAFLMIWYLMISGLVYNIITDPSPYGKKQDGSPNWFHPSSHAQFGLEGFYVGFFTVGLAVILLIANETIPRLNAKLGSTFASIILNLLGIVATLSALLAFDTLKSFYKMKMGGYPF